MQDPETPSLVLPRIRTDPEDFEVEELPLETPEGPGEHLYLWIEKRLRNTEDIVNDLATLAEVSAREIGFAGRKDRYAVTRQWFSVPRFKRTEAQAWALQGCRILETREGKQRLRLGELRGNRFRLRVRDALVSNGEDDLRRKLETLERQGCPNLFGRQRFGSRGDNVDQGKALLRGEAARSGRRIQGLLIAAVQALVFNEILLRRPWPLDELVPGDVARVPSSGRLFVVAEAEAGSSRLQRFKVSPTGPLFGFKTLAATGAVGALETEVLQQHGVADLRALRVPTGVRLDGERRALRFALLDVAFEAEDQDAILAFTLPAGAYATTVLEQLFPRGFQERPGSRRES